MHICRGVRGVSLGLVRSKRWMSRDATIKNILDTKLRATKSVVTDTSGGCGSMFDIYVESPIFTGKPLVAQHRMVTDALKEEIKGMHGLTIKTKVPAN